MSKIKLKFLNNLKQSELQVANIVAKICPEINIKDAYTSPTFAMLVLGSAEEKNKLLSTALINKLETYNLKPVPSPEMEPNKSLFINRLKPYIISQPTENIIQQINSSNDFSVSKVFIVNPKDSAKSPSSIKVVFDSTEHLETALTIGIRMFNFKIDPEFMQRVEYVKINQCFKCFKYSHLTHQCKETISYCSICSLTHNFRQCPNITKPRCINCDGKHSAIAYVCPVRKLELANATEVAQQNKTHDLPTESLDKAFPQLPPKNPAQQQPPQPKPQRQQERSSFAKVAASSNLTNPPTPKAPPKSIPTPLPDSPTSFRIKPNPRPPPSHSSPLSQVFPPPLPTHQKPQFLPSTSNPTPSSDHSSIVPPPPPPPPPGISNPPHPSDSHLPSQVPMPHPQPLIFQYPPPPPPPSDTFQSHEWDIKLSIWKSLAEKLAPTDHYTYGKIMNEFLIQHNLSPINLDRIFQIAGHPIPSSTPTPTDNPVPVPSPIPDNPIPVPSPIPDNPVPVPSPIPRATQTSPFSLPPPSKDTPCPMSSPSQTQCSSSPSILNPLMSKLPPIPSTSSPILFASDPALPHPPIKNPNPLRFTTPPTFQSSSLDLYLSHSSTMPHPSPRRTPNSQSTHSSTNFNLQHSNRLSVVEENPTDSSDSNISLVVDDIQSEQTLTNSQDLFLTQRDPVPSVHGYALRSNSRSSSSPDLPSLSAATSSRK